jgi:hypothetical protein
MELNTMTDIYGSQTATDWYLSNGGNPTPGALALMAEVQRGRERRNNNVRERDETPDERKRRCAVDDELRRRFLQGCRPATAADYATWLRGYLKRGGAITHEYPYPMSRADVVVLTRSGLDLPSLYGARALEVIVPAGLTLSTPATFHGRCGHSTVYLMDGFAIVGNFVPTYPDVVAHLGR